jgi:hypothetical protein
LGLLAGVGYVFGVPAAHTASATLVLTHDSQVDPARAMATDLSLLTTRTVAERVIKTLGLSVAPESLQKSVSALPSTSDVLVLTLSAGTGAEAVRRLEAFTTAYLDFRATQISAQSDALVKGFSDRIATQQTQVDELTKRIQGLTGGGETGTNQLSDAITQRAQANAQIDTLQQSVQDATLRRSAIVSASRVIDPAAVEPGGGTRRLALALASGLIGGAAVGIGLVLLSAIVSDRLRLRVEVASALGVATPVSVGRLAPRSGLLRPFRGLRPIRLREIRRAADLQRMAGAIEAALPATGRGQRLVVACVDNADEVRLGVAAAAVALQNHGRTVRLVDLTEQGRLEAAVAWLLPGSDVDRPTVSRPRSVPSLARGPADLHDADAEADARTAAGSDGDAGQDAGSDADADEQGRTVSLTEVSLVLADLNPSIGADHLAAWTERVIVVVTGGLSSAERVRTAGELVRWAGLDLRSAVLIRADPRDGSSGVPPATGEPPGAGAAGVQQR